MTFLLPVRTDNAPGDNATPVFLHTAWRSRGTWIWAALRRDPRAMALYEPLHEALATLTPAVITARRPDAWPSGHDAMAPYWTEFAGLLRPGMAGVPGYRTEFAIENAFADADATAPELATYLQGLLAHAAAGRVPVFKFCRSMGRVAWMRASFPDALHIVVLRRPDAQWASARRQLARHGNPYFLVMPLLTLARNADVPVVARACRALRVPLPRLRHGDMERATEACRLALEQLSWTDRYRAFLAYWTACAVSALATDTLLIDADMLLWSPHYRSEVAAAMAWCSGLRLALPLDPAHRNADPSPLGCEETAVQHAALAFLQEHRTALRPDGYVMAWNMLASCLLARPAAMAADDDAEWAEIPAMAPSRPWFRATWGRLRQIAAFS